jgi:hypothetical protein
MSVPATIADALTAATAPLEALLTGSPDRCSIVNRTAVTGTSGGATYTDTTTASNVPVLYSERRYRPVQVAGEPSTYVTHDLYLIKSAAAEAIQPDYKIVVTARGANPQLTFENLLRLDASLSPLVHLGANLKP